MKQFANPPFINPKTAEKTIRRLIYRFFSANIGVKKIRVNGELKDKIFFSFKRPFHGANGEVCTPDALTRLFPAQELYVLRHYAYQANPLPLFCARAEAIAQDLADLDALCQYEYAYIFDKNLSACFWVSDSCAPYPADANGKTEKHAALLIRYEPIKR